MGIGNASALRKGRFSEEGRIYLVTFVTEGRSPWFNSFELGRIIVSVMKNESQFAETLAFVVMPDHVHWLVQLNKKPLNQTVHDVKSISAHRINRMLGGSGRFWQDGIIRMLGGSGRFWQDGINRILGGSGRFWQDGINRILGGSGRFWQDGINRILGGSGRFWQDGINRILGGLGRFWQDGINRILGGSGRFWQDGINRMLGRSGRFWQDGFHDHAVLKYEDVVDLARYVVMNPVRGGLVKSIRDYPMWDAVWI